MNIPVVRLALHVLNYADGSNRDGTCTSCAVLAADALVSGNAPQGMATDYYTIDDEAGQRGIQKLFTSIPDNLRNANEHARGFEIWRWLLTAQNGVYVFEQDEDHVYNFVKHVGIYLIDSAAQIYQQVHTPAHCLQVSLAYPANFDPQSNSQFGYNYINPYSDGNNDVLNVYRWGNLHQNWH